MPRRFGPARAPDPRNHWGRVPRSPSKVSKSGLGASVRLRPSQFRGLAAATSHRGWSLTRVYGADILLWVSILDQLRSCSGFEWDSGNLEKSRLKHGVSPYESEEVFFNQPLVVADDDDHFDDEPRYFTLGQTNQGRLLFVVFTVRHSLIRVISARDMTRKEREVYRAHG